MKWILIGGGALIGIGIVILLIMQIINAQPTTYGGRKTNTDA